MKKIAVLVSGGGSNLQSIIDSIDNGDIKNAEISVVISNKESAFGLERARKSGIDAVFSNDEGEIKNIIQQYGCDLIVLAGFLKILSKDFINAFENRIINIHPSLIPSFCGVGYYGMNVHRAVVEYGVKVSGATVHFVEVKADAGPIIMQEVVEVLPEDTAEDVSKKVLEVEHRLLPKVVGLFSENRVRLKGRKVFITEIR